MRGRIDHGRMPDDTWILRPQDLVNGFDPDEDLWYFPRVAGTVQGTRRIPWLSDARTTAGSQSFGLAQIADDVVIDPFSGSATTLAVAKKLGRQYFGFEMSRDYVKLGTQRLDGISVGDRLDGSEEPTMNGLSTKEKQRKEEKAKDEGRSFAEALCMGSGSPMIRSATKRSASLNALRKRIVVTRLIDSWRTLC